MVLLLLLGFAFWFAQAAYKSGKREGSRKGYGVGYDRGRRHSSSNGGCLAIVLATLALGWLFG